MWEWRYRQWNRDQGHRSYSLSFMHLLMRLMILNVDNLLICIYVVYTKYNYIFLNLTNFDFEKKVWQNRGRCTRVGKRVKRRGGEQCYLELHPMFLSTVVPELRVHLFHNGISLRHAVCIKQTELSYLCQYLCKNITPTITWCEFGRYEDWFKD